MEMELAGLAPLNHFIVGDEPDLIGGFGLDDLRARKAAERR